MSYVDPETDDAVLLDLIAELPPECRTSAFLLALMVGSDD